MEHLGENKDDKSWAEYKKVRNYVSRLAVNAKNDSSKLWKSLKQLGYSSRFKSKTRNITLDLGSNVTAQKVTVADSFLQLLVNWWKNYLTSQGSRVSHFFDFYSQQEVKANGFSFDKVSEAVVLEKLKNRNGSKATGLDNIPARFLRDAAEVITQVLPIS